MKLDILPSIILPIFFAIFGSSALADSFHDIARQARAKLVAAQTDWQRDLARLMIRTNPEFREIATAGRDLQLAFIEQGTARFQYLLENNPSRIVLMNGLSRFANFDWTEADTKGLANVDPAYAKLQERIATLETRNNQSPDWEKFRAWFRGTFTKSADYKTLLSELEAKQKEVEKLLAKYKPQL